MSQCWCPSSEGLRICGAGYTPCGDSAPGVYNATSGIQLCCAAGDQCGANSICKFDKSNPRNPPNGSGYYIGGCTDKNFIDPLCRSDCHKSPALPTEDVVYVPDLGLWSCCGHINNTGPVDCSLQVAEKSFQITWTPDEFPGPINENLTPAIAIQPTTSALDTVPLSVELVTLPFSDPTSQPSSDTTSQPSPDTIFLSSSDATSQSSSIATLQSPSHVTTRPASDATSRSASDITSRSASDTTFRSSSIATTCSTTSCTSSEASSHQCSSSTLSDRTKAGIGVGIAFGVLLIIGFTAMLFFLLRGLPRRAALARVKWHKVSRTKSGDESKMTGIHIAIHEVGDTSRYEADGSNLRKIEDSAPVELPGDSLYCK